MYALHPDISEVPDDLQIWRFMDLAKFIYLLESQSLFFARPNQFADPWEGYIPRQNVIDTAEVLKDEPDIVRTRIFQSMLEVLPKTNRDSFGVSCWHVSEHESEALWRTYANRAVAIRSTVGKLKQAFAKNSTYNEYLGRVLYTDHDKGVIPIGNLFHHILWKRLGFEYEKELRAIIWELEDSAGKGARPFDDPRGQAIPIDVNTLIESVHTTPFETGAWFNSTVSDLLRRYEYIFPCVKSGLMDLPSYNYPTQPPGAISVAADSVSQVEDEGAVDGA